MNEGRLKQLRRKQLIFFNTLLALGFGITLLIIQFGILGKMFHQIIGIILFVQGIQQLFKIKGLLLLLFPSMNELMKYEKEKLGKESKKIGYFTGFVLILAGISQFYIGMTVPNHQPNFTPDMLWFLLSFYILLIVFINVYQLYHNHKIDRNRNEESKGYAGNMILISVAGGVIIAFATFFAAIILVIS